MLDRANSKSRFLRAPLDALPPLAGTQGPAYKATSYAQLAVVKAHVHCLYHHYYYQHCYPAAERPEATRRGLRAAPSRSASAPPPPQTWALTLTMATLALAVASSLVASLIISPLLAAAGQSPPAPCPRAIQVNSNPHFRNRLHFVCLQLPPANAYSQNPSFARRLDVIDFASNELVASQSIAEPNANLLASFVDESGILRVLIATPDKINGTTMLSVHPTRGLIGDELQTINTQLVSALTVWRLELSLSWQLAVANQPKPSNAIEQYVPPVPIISVFRWRHTYFDAYQRFHLPYNAHVAKLEPLSVNGIDFLVVALQPPLPLPAVDAYHKAAGVLSSPASLLYRLWFADGQLDWRFHQVLPTRAAFDVRAFSLRSRAVVGLHHYIALVGVHEDDSYVSRLLTQPRTSPVPIHGLAIYKYYGNSFARSKLVTVPGATRLDSLAGSGDAVVIAVMSTRAFSVQLFLFDGATLSPLSAPQEFANRHGFAPARPLSVHLFRVPTPTNEKRTLDSPTDSSSAPDEGQPALIVATAPPSGDLVRKSAPNAAHSASLSSTKQRSDSTLHSTRQQQQQQPSVYLIPTLELKTPNAPEEHLPDKDAHILSEQEGGDAKNETDLGKRQFNSSPVSPSNDEHVLDWCVASIRMLRADNFNTMASNLRSMARLVDDPIAGPVVEISGDLVIDGDLEVTERLSADSILEAVIPGSPPVPMRQFQDAYDPNFDSAEALINSINTELGRLSEHVNELLVDDGTQQDVFAAVEFDELRVECQDWSKHAQGVLGGQFRVSSCPHVDELQTPLLNGYNISDLETAVLLTGRPITVNRDVRFERLILRDTTQINARLNDLLIEDIIFKSAAGRAPPLRAPTLVTGAKTFAGGLMASNAHLLVGQWNDVPVNVQTVLTARHDQRIDADVRVEGAVVLAGRNSRIERLNGINLNAFLDQLVLADAPALIETPVEFDTLELNGPVQFASNRPALISGVDLDDVWAHAMLKHAHQNISAPMHFAQLTVSHGGDIQVNGLVNGVQFAPGLIMTKSGGGLFTSPVLIEGSVKVKTPLQVNKAINGIQVVPNQYNQNKPELAILLNVGDQLVTGAKVLDELVLGGNSTLVGHINGHLDLNHLYKLATRAEAAARVPAEPFRFDRVRLAHPDIRLGSGASMHIARAINGVPVDELCALATFAERSDARVHYNSLRFEQAVNFKSLRCASINGFTNLRASFMTKTDSQHIRGTIRLAGGATFNSSLIIQHTLNGMNASVLSKAVRTQLSESQTRRKSVIGDLELDDLVAERIDGLNLRDVFATHPDVVQVVRAPIVVDDLDLENVLTVNSNLNVQHFNGVNVTDVLTNTLQYDTPQIIKAHLILDTLRIAPGANLRANSLNGISLRRVMSDAVLVDVPQQIVGAKTFAAPVHMRAPTYFRHSLAGLTPNDLRLSHQLLNSDDSYIDADVVFTNDVRVYKELDIETGLVNDININQFERAMLYENKTRLDNPRKMAPLIVHGQGSVRFNDLAVQNLVVTGTIQGVDVSKASAEARVRYPNQRPLQLALPIYAPPPPAAMNMSKMQTVWRPQMPQRAPPLPPPAATPALQLQARPAPQGQLIPAASQSRTVHTTLSTPTLEPPLSLARAMQQFEARAISALTTRVSRLLPVALYYNFLQKHALLGPLLSACRNPDGPGSLLLLKTIGARGEPCAHGSQSIAVLRQNPSTAAFMQGSTLSDASNPVIVQPLIVLDANNNARHLIFVASVGNEPEASQVLVYAWNRNSGRHELLVTIPLTAYPTDMQAFSLNGLACIALAQPRVVLRGNTRGTPTLYCEAGVRGSLFEQRVAIDVQHAVRLSTLQLSADQVLLAVLSLPDGSHIGDLTVWLISANGFGTPERLAARRLVRPTAIHLFEGAGQGSGNSRIVARIAAAEAAGAGDGGTANLRLYALEAWLINRVRLIASATRLAETQVVKGDEFAEVQSVRVSPNRALLFGRSSNSISILAPSAQQLVPAAGHCAADYALVQRLPTRGANKFAVFADSIHGIGNTTHATLAGHLLVLSREDCERQEFETVILKSYFG